MYTTTVFVDASWFEKLSVCTQIDPQYSVYTNGTVGTDLNANIHHPS